MQAEGQEHLKRLLDSSGARSGQLGRDLDREMARGTSGCLGVNSTEGIYCLETEVDQEGESERWCLVSASGPRMMEREARESLGKMTSCECLRGTGKQRPAGMGVIWSGAPERSWRASVSRMQEGKLGVEEVCLLGVVRAERGKGPGQSSGWGLT